MPQSWSICSRRGIPMCRTFFRLRQSKLTAPSSMRATKMGCYLSNTGKKLLHILSFKTGQGILTKSIMK